MTLRTVQALIEAGLAADDQRTELEAVAATYAVAVTPTIAALIERDRQSDPIARQFLPSPNELTVTSAERYDPIGDEAFTPVKGIVHRYPDRVLLKPTHTCPVYCRFCFRREVVGPDGAGNLTADELEQALAYIRVTPAVWEVIITGGDPFILSPRRLQEIVDALDRIDHVCVIRFHTRVPVVDPDRVDDALLQALSVKTRVYVALHANHPRELTDKARAACARLRDCGISMVSQTVLLRGVNDDSETLAALMRGFVEMGIHPYYLHHPDLARGTSHFRITLAEGQALVSALRGRLSGLCQPTYVLDIPGGFGKTPVGPAYATPIPGNHEKALVEDYQGHKHIYRTKGTDD